MIPSKNFGTTPRVGLEIEVVKWEGTKRNKICEELIERGLMPVVQSGNGDYRHGYHPYHCTCMDCKMWISEDRDPFPVQFALTYDASLPESGGEFISSPFILNDVFLESLRGAFDIITRKAVWDNTSIDLKGRPSSPSIHVHTSVQNPFDEKAKKSSTQQNIISALEYFVPEFFALASSCGIRRGLMFRLPAIGGHHGFINFVRDISKSGKYVHLEYRFWEAAYDQWEYIVGAIYLSSAMTQIVTNTDILEKVVAFSLLYPNSFEYIYKGDPPSETKVGFTLKDILGYYDDSRMDFLEHLLFEFTPLKHDSAGQYYVTKLFANTRSMPL